MAKKALDTTITEIKKQLEAGKIILGTKETVAALKKGRLRKAYITQNCNALVREDIERYAKLAGAEVVALEYPSDEIGTLCKKPYSVQVLGLSR
ncbi:MAG: ribosomal L7Ae/L30e/S12e/Gadd45 family protein [Nanoarchaeota archaeon]